MRQIFPGPSVSAQRCAVLAGLITDIDQTPHITPLLSLVTTLQLAVALDHWTTCHTDQERLTRR